MNNNIFSLYAREINKKNLCLFDGLLIREENPLNKFEITMEQSFTRDRTFDKQDFTEKLLAKGEYDTCSFLNCDFSESDLSEIIFMDCVFENCNLSMAKLKKTALRDIKFHDCKMLGLQFGDCNEFGLDVSFENCNLSHSSFFKTKFRKNLFKNLKLNEADFTEADLSGSVFDNCELTRAIFENTNIEKTDFRSSFNYIIDPEKNKIRKARFSLAGIPGLLVKYDIEIDF